MLFRVLGSRLEVVELLSQVASIVLQLLFLGQKPIAQDLRWGQDKPCIDSVLVCMLAPYQRQHRGTTVMLWQAGFLFRATHIFPQPSQTLEPSGRLAISLAVISDLRLSLCRPAILALVMAISCCDCSAFCDISTRS